MSDIRRQGEPSNMEDTIPFTFVTWGMYIKLANKLDPDCSVNGNNWRMLAEKLGYSTQAIMVFEAQNMHQGRNTLKLLSDYSQRHGSTVNALHEALESIERPDAVGELLDGLPDIKKSYHESKKQCRGPLDETEFHCYSCGNKPFDSSHFHQAPSHHPSMMSSISKCPPHSNRNGLSHNISGHVVSHSGHMRPSLHGGPAFSDNRKQFQRHISVDSACTAHNRPTQYEQLSPELKRQKSVNDSMAVRGHDNHSQYFPNQIEPMDYSSAVREEPVPPAVGILRGIQRFDRQAGPENFMNSYLASSQEREGLFRHPLPPGAGHGERGMHLKLKIPQPGEPRSYRPHHMDMGEEFSSPSPTPSTPSTPLDRLTQLTHDKKFQPDEAYTDLMRMKQEEESLQGRTYPANHEDSDPYPCHGDHQPGHASPAITARQNCEKTAALMCKPKSATLEKEPPNTYPLRVKSTFCLSSSSNPTSGSQILMKSASVPSNLKPAEFRIAFRDIKVFVTYSDDDKRHTQRVLGLCKCLGKNGFTCCVDIYPRKLLLEDRNSWYQKRFEEADFILMVVSPKYKNEVDMCEMDNDADDSDSMDSDDGTDRGNRPHQLHTKQIYRLMFREYTQAGGRCTRFVPVLFQGLQEQLIPDWIYKAFNRVYYMWPEQYKDLLWMLTKPEARIPQAQVALPDRESSQEASDSSELNTESD